MDNTTAFKQKSKRPWVKASYCRSCGQETLVQKNYHVNNQFKRCCFCINKGCGFRLEI